MCTARAEPSTKNGQTLIFILPTQQFKTSVCLICSETVTIIKSGNVKRHDEIFWANSPTRIQNDGTDNKPNMIDHQGQANPGLFKRWASA